MMMFRTIKNQIEGILGSAAVGRFRVVGYAGQSRAAEEVLGVDRSVQVFFSEGAFDRNSSRNMRGPIPHDTTFRIELTVGEGSKVDLSVLQDPSSSAVEIAAAISAFQEASYLADQSFDELADLVLQIIMDARNYDLGLTKGSVANRWIAHIRKDSPTERGQYVVLTGSMDMTCKVMEEIVGDTPEVGGEFDITIDIDGDDVEQTGVAGTLGGQT